MRIWSLHPKYLDAKGLVAVWREALLAQMILKGETLGYTKHPQLERFKSQPDPLAAIATYLHGVYEEAQRRGYHFDNSKIVSRHTSVQIITTKSQVLYELEHLRNKLKKRDHKRYLELKKVINIEAHNMFMVIDGEVEPWERR